MLLNLFSNARRFTEVGHVRLEAGASNGGVRISIADKEDTQPDSQITIGRSDGLRISEVLRCLEAAIAIIEPHYDDRTTLEHAPEPNVL